MTLNMYLAQINEHNGYDWNRILLQNRMHYVNSAESTLNILAIRSSGDSLYNKTVQTINSKHVIYCMNSKIIMVVCYCH